MLQQTRDSKCHCCLIVKYSSQLHKQFTSPIPLVQFNWYCERGGDNDKVLTWGRDLINLFFPKDVYRRSLFFFLALHARSRTLASLADVFEKNEKKKKTMSLYKLGKFERMAREAMGVCLRVLKESNKSRFDSYSVRNSVLIISHFTFGDCRVHILSDNLSRTRCISGVG